MLWRDDDRYATQSATCGGGICRIPTSEQRAALKRYAAQGGCLPDNVALLTTLWR